MSYEDLLEHECDIFHLQSESVDSGFGIPSEDRQSRFFYGDSPDVTEQSCYFTEKTQTITQGEPNREIHQTFLVHFPIEADIQLNDKVVWEGITLKAQKPRNIKDHHIEVTMIRRDSL